MKRLNFIFGACALIAVCMTASPALFAQENGNRDEYGNIVRGPYETNGFGDNWFIGAGGGINVFWNDGYKIAIAPSIDASLGKWFTPAVGMRIGYQGFQSKVLAPEAGVLGNVRNSDGTFDQKFGYMYIHGDFLWNMSNALSGYKETRFWNLVPYFHAGFYRSYGLDDAEFHNNEIAGGAGLLHNLRLTDRLDIMIDMRATVVNGRVIQASGPSLLGSVTAGLAVDLGWPAFIRTSTVLAAAEIASAERIAVLETAALAMEAANAALLVENQQLANANAVLSEENSALKDKVSQEMNPADFYDGMAPAVYFEIGKAVLSPVELKHLEFIAEQLIAKADDSTKITITVMGTADSNTGTTKRNVYLSEARGRYVFDILVDKYGIDEDSLVLTSEIIDAEDNPQFDRAVKITF